MSRLMATIALLIAALTSADAAPPLHKKTVAMIGVRAAIAAAVVPVASVCRRGVWDDYAKRCDAYD